MMIWRFLPFRQSNAFENMAIDEAIFRENQRTESPPTLRFYRWFPPAISMGYFQEVWNEVDVEACTRYGIDIVRRPTGGKAVLHEHDLTYAVVAKVNNPLFPPDIPGTYRIISGCISDCLSEFGIETEMTISGRSSQDDALKASCFSTPSQYELLVKKRKICGSAQVRSRSVFLQHGSLLLEFDPLKTCEVLLPHHDNHKTQVEKMRRSVTSVYGETGLDADIGTLCRVLKKCFEKRLGITLVEGDLNPEEEALKTRLVRDKYMNTKWNMEGKGVVHGYKDAGSDRLPSLHS